MAETLYGMIQVFVLFVVLLFLFVGFFSTFVPIIPIALVIHRRNVREQRRREAGYPMDENSDDDGPIDVDIAIIASQMEHNRHSR